MKILVVEDDAVVRDLITKLLSCAGHEVRIAENGKSAWEYLQSNGVDLCVSDVNMPEMDGWELLRNTRALEKTSRLYFILLTVRQLNEDKICGSTISARTII